MMITLNKIFFLLLCCLSGGAGAYAQDTLSLNRAINLALKNSLDIQVATNDREAATILNDFYVAGGGPVVTGTLTDNEQLTSVNQKLNTGITIQRNNVAANSLGVGITGSMLLYNGGRVIANKKRLAELQTQSGNRLDAQVQNIIAAVMTAYYDIVRQQDYIKTLDRSIAVSDQQLSIVKTKQNVGLANNADLFQAQIDRNALQQSREAQLLIIAQAKTELLRLLTLKTDSAVVIRDTIIPARDVSLPAVLDNIPKTAEVAVAGDQVRINEMIVKETNALRYPFVRATAGYNFTRNNSGAGQVLLNQNYGPVIGLSLGIPIFNGGASRKQVKAAKIEVNNAELRKDILLRDLTAQAVRQFESYNSTLAQLETERENYRLTGQLLDLVLLRFQLRQATIVEMKNAQQSFEASGFRLVNLSYAAKASEIELKRIAGQLVP